MAIQSGITVRWKQLAMGGHPNSISPGYQGFKIALFSSLASLTTLSTSLYSAALPGEISASSGMHFRRYRIRHQERDFLVSGQASR